MHALIHRGHIDLVDRVRLVNPVERVAVCAVSARQNPCQGLVVKPASTMTVVAVLASCVLDILVIIVFHEYSRIIDVAV